MSYAMSHRVHMSVDEADDAVREALADEGFGVLTEIDVRATLAKKLGVDVPEHRILGACNPSFAHQGLEAEPDLSVLLPCNVTVRAEGGDTVVSAVDPVVQLGVAANDDLEAIASEVRDRLGRALQAVAAS